MRLASKVTMNPRREPCYRLVVATAGAKGPPPCFEAQGFAVQRPQRPLLFDLRPVAEPYFTICLDQPSRFQSGLTRSDHIASADDRFLKAAAIEQSFVQVKAESLNRLHVERAHATISASGHCARDGFGRFFDHSEKNSRRAVRQRSPPLPFLNRPDTKTKPSRERRL